MKTLWSVEPFGEGAWLVRFQGSFEPDVAVQLHAIAAALRLRATQKQSPWQLVTEIVPAFKSLLVRYDPLAAKSASLKDALLELINNCRCLPLQPGRCWKLPVSFSNALDLEAISCDKGLNRKEIIDILCSIELQVFFLGFLPGFPYMGTIPEQLRMPRRATPRTRVAAGSVAIAECWCGIYPFDSPAGWHIIGATPWPLWDPGRDPPALLAPGDRVRFIPLDR